MERGTALDYMHKKMTTNVFDDSDVDFIVAYIKHIHDKDVEGSEIISAVNNRLAYSRSMMSRDSLTPILNSMYFHIVKKFNLSIREIENHSKK